MDNVLKYARARLLEVIFLIVAAVALFSTCTYGFHVEDSLRNNWLLIIGWVAVLMMAFTAASYSPRAVLIGGIAILVVGFAIMVATSIAGGFGLFDDEYGNVGFFLLIGFIVSGLSYLGTRRKSLAVAYLVAGLFTCALIQFLYLNGLLWQMIVYVVAAVAIYAFSSQRRVATVNAGSISRPSVFATAAAVCAVAIAIACAVFFLIIAPLNPPAHDLKLITRYYALEEVHVSGLQEIEHKQDEEKRSDQEEEGDDQTNRENELTEDTQPDPSTDEDVGNEGEDLGTEGINISGSGEETGAIRYFVDFPYWIFIPIGVVVLIALVIAAKVLLRRRRYRRLCALPPEEGIIAFYLFFTKRLKRFDVEKPEAMTLHEYVREHAAAFLPFEEGAEGASYLALTDSYCACVYGKATPDEHAIQNCKQLYSVFYQNARKVAGRVKYWFTKFLFI